MGQRDVDSELPAACRDLTSLCLRVSCRDGLSGSNSYCFIRAGWDAVLVEPFPEHQAKILHNLKPFMHTATQSVKLVRGVVGTKHGQTQLTVFDGENSKTSNTAMDVTNPEAHWAQTHRVRVGDSVTRLTVDSYTPKTLMETASVPSKFAVLSVDAEGLDVAVLRGFIEAGARPLMAIVEIRGTEREDRAFMEAAGYRELAHAGANYIWELVRWE